jgi:hypothetical protein
MMNIEELGASTATPDEACEIGEWLLSRLSAAMAESTTAVALKTLTCIEVISKSSAVFAKELESGDRTVTAVLSRAGEYQATDPKHGTKPAEIVRHKAAALLAKCSNADVPI